jgi:phospholipid-translocating ATPase
MERQLYYNQPLPESAIDPETGMPLAHYSRNKIRTTKYTPLNFVPKNLLYQFRNIANIYFLFIVILSAISIFGVQDPGLAAVPIICIVIITAIKDAIEDYRRTVLDLELNNTVTTVLTNLPNANVVEEDISGWRRFKKACTRFYKKVFIFVAAKTVHRNKGEHEKGVLSRVLTTDLHSVYTEGSSVYAAQPVDTQDTYGDSGPNSAGSAVADSGLGSGISKDQTTKTFVSVVDPTRNVTGDAKFRRNFWKHLKCGDIVKIHGDEEVPADVVILSTSDPDGGCFIETKNLDGETNLKPRKALNATSSIKHSRDLEQAVFRVECEGPQPNLYTFNGVLKWEHRSNSSVVESPPVQYSEPISIDNLLLRGSTLRNTTWAIGYVVYTGAETKIMLNSGITPTKRSRMMRHLNLNVVLNFVFLFILAFVGGVVNGVYFNKTNTSAYFFEFGMIGGTPPVNGIVSFWALTIQLQSLIPISLYISIEIIKTIQAYFIYSDIYMYYEPLDYPCTPKTWNISDDVGQVEYIFSDKTGTLTKNVMEFRKCTINGKPYGNAMTQAMIGMMKRTGSESGQDVEKLTAQATRSITQDKAQMFRKLRDYYDNRYLFADDAPFVSSEVVDDMTGASGDEQKAAIESFFLDLALCHSAIPEHAGDDNEKLIFKAQSPDEAALVATARDLGFTMLERTRNGVVIDVLGKRKEYTILSELEFNSTRKRMSVVVQEPTTGRLYLICKGADSVIYQRLAPGHDDVKRQTAENLETFANEGLRTLCIAERELSWDYYRDWAKRYEEASSALQDREEKMEMVMEEIECDLVLVGGTAIEDELQDGVADSIALLGHAGIKLWVLTGDKVETAINIGYSCNLLENSMELLVLQAPLNDTVRTSEMLTEFLNTRFNMQGTPEELELAKKDHNPPPPTHALVIDGDTLQLVLDDEGMSMKLVLLGKQCKSVLCCRVSPAQKAAVVRLMKGTLDVTTLSIGDGANDVAMIQEADVGVGIAGLEGRQAVMSSDYAIGQFRFLVRLVLVHGRWSYYRLAEMTANLFYKNVVFTLTLFWYNIDNNFDVSYLFDYSYIVLFNLAFTSLPVIFMGIGDQDVSDLISLTVPQLYTRGILRKEWTNKKFYFYIVDGVYQSAACYFLSSYCVFFNGGFVTTSGRQINYREAYGVFTATAAIMACNFYVMLNEYYWNWLFLLIVAISSLLVFFWTGVYTAFTASQTFYDAAPQVYGTLVFWATMLLVMVITLLPRFVIKAYQKMFMPYDVDIVREQRSKHVFDNLVYPAVGSAHVTPLIEKPIEEEKQQDSPDYSDPLAPPLAAGAPPPWRQSIEHRFSGERMRSSMDIPELTTARTLLSTTQSR